MSKINLIEIINNVLKILNKIWVTKIKILKLKLKKNKLKNGKYILGIENRLEQVIANLLYNYFI